MLETLRQKRIKAPCRYCGGIFRTILLSERRYEYVLRCDKCAIQTRPFDFGEQEEEQNRLILGESVP